MTCFDHGTEQDILFKTVMTEGEHRRDGNGRAGVTSVTGRRTNARTSEVHDQKKKKNQPCVFHLPTTIEAVDGPMMMKTLQTSFT